METWLQMLLTQLALPEYGLSTVFVISFISATLLPLGSEPAVFGLVKLNPDLFWAIRGGGWLLMFVGLLAVFQPAVIAPQIVPLVGGLVSGLTSCTLCTLATAMATAVAPSREIASQRRKRKNRCMGEARSADRRVASAELMKELLLSYFPSFRVIIRSASSASETRRSFDAMK